MTNPAFPSQPDMALAWQQLRERVMHGAQISHSVASVYLARADSAGDLVDAEWAHARGDAYMQVLVWIAQLENAWGQATSHEHI